MKVRVQIPTEARHTKLYLSPNYRKIFSSLLLFGLLVTHATSNATSSGKIHFITKYFNARWGFLVRVLLHNMVEKINKLEEFYDNLAKDTT